VLAPHAKLRATIVTNPLQQASERALDHAMRMAYQRA